MNVSLTPELEKFVQDRVATGRYHSASEVVRDALRALERDDEMRRVTLDELRRQVQIGIDAADRGELREFNEQVVEEIKRRGRERLRTQRQGKSA